MNLQLKVVFAGVTVDSLKLSLYQVGQNGDNIFVAAEGACGEGTISSKNLFYKISYSNTSLIFLGFITGLIIDLAMQTYGCHTFATISICYLRERIEKNSFGVNANLPLAMIKGTKMINRFTFFMVIIFIH